MPLFRPPATVQYGIITAASSLSGNTTLTGALTSSSGANNFSYNSGTGVYTISRTCLVTITWSLTSGASASQASIVLNGTTLIGDFTGTSGTDANTSWSGQLVANDTISLKNTSVGAAAAYYGNVTATYFSP